MIGNFILLGPPGAGKGTIGQALQEKFGHEHFSSGDLLRKEVKDKTQIGKDIASVLDVGGQVSDALITDLVTKKLKELTDERRKFVLDGFPQTLNQFHTLESFAKENNIEFTYICFHVEPKTALDRMVNRITCSSCLKIFSKSECTSDICTHCSGKLSLRKSDEEHIAKQRLDLFEKTTKQVIRLAEENPKTLSIDSDREKDDVLHSLISNLWEGSR